MIRLQFSWLAVLASTFTLASTSYLRAQNQPPTQRSGTDLHAVASTCKVYSLKDWSSDPNFGQWIAQTIPQVIQPGTWNTGVGESQKQRLSYYPQGKVLVIYHTDAVQTEVASFLDNLKKALPQDKERIVETRGQTMMPNSKVTPVTYLSSAPLPVADTPRAAHTFTYPVPAPVQHPKHLFHLIVRAEGLGDLGTNNLVKELSGEESEVKDQPKSEPAKTPTINPAVTFILRYEGEGIIDSTVADVLKEIYSPKNAAKTEEDSAASKVLQALGTMGTTVRPIVQAAYVPESGQTLLPLSSVLPGSSSSVPALPPRSMPAAEPVPQTLPSLAPLPPAPSR